jgi:hypothetical protein
MFGWYYDKITRSLNRYEDNDLISTIQYDNEEKFYVLFSKCTSEKFEEEMDFVQALKKEEGYQKLIILAEINHNKYIKNKLGAFYIDKDSMSEDLYEDFKMEKSS